MTDSLRLFVGLVVLLGLGTPLAEAQIVQPLGAEPAHAPSPASGTARRGMALTLPFFDDFSTQAEGKPAEQNWETTGGALINNRFPRRPPSRGVATLDGLDANGRPRGPVSFIGDADSLVSQPLDLSRLTAADRVYLSFFWQAGTLVGPPVPSGTRPVALYVDFLDRDKQWRPVWQLRSQGDTTNFRFKALPVDQSDFFHAAFQFRFRVSGYLYSARDAWSVDYVRMDRNRTATDSAFRDIATSRPLPSALTRYTAMPVGQFNQNPAQELAARTATTINNLDAGPAPTPITWTGTLDVLPSGASSQFLTGGRSLDANTRQQPVVGNPRLATIPATPAAKLLRQRITLLTNETNPLTLPNDTISRLTELGDYYAYDDGTAEASVSLTPTSTGPARYHALRFDLNGPDLVRAIRIAPLLTAAGRTITLSIWDDDGSGKPTPAPKASKSFTIPSPLPAGRPFIEVVFDAPVPVSQRFYAGYGQAATPQFVEFGLDLNNAVPKGFFLLNALGTWSTTSTASAVSPEGALMLRPVLGSTVTSANAPTEIAAAYYLFPNPTADGRVRVQGRYARAIVVDALGRVVWEQPAAQAGKPELALPPLPAGVYFVRLARADGLVVTKRLSVTGY